MSALLGQDERIVRARQMRAEGKLLREIAAEFGVSIRTAANWANAAATPCACGCGGDAITPARFIFGHHTRLAEDFNVNPQTGCWDWLGAKNKKGYGLVKRDRRSVTAYRWYYEQHKGPVPKGLEIDHLCRNRACVNPEHLEAVTAATNSQRRSSSKVTWDVVRAIRASGLGCAEVARRWGISESLASDVLRGKTWKEAA